MQKVRTIVLLGTVIAIFLGLRVPLLFKEYVPEDVAWVSAGEGVARTGFPWVYLGENGKIVADWKPPGFQLLLGLSYAIFGSHEWSSRLVPLAFALGQIFLIYALAKNVFSGPESGIIGIIAAFLLATNPFSIQNSVQIDIDGGLVAFFILLMIFFSWQLFRTQRMAAFPSLGFFLSTAAAFFIRLETPIFAMGAIASSFFIFRRKNAVRFAFLALIATCISILAIIGYYALFGEISRSWMVFGIIFEAVKNRLAGATAAPIRYNYVEDVIAKIHFKPLANFLKPFVPNLAFITISSLWITLPLCFLIVYSLWEAVRLRLFREERFSFLLIPAFIILFFFTLMGSGANFPRYIQPSLNLLYIALAFFMTIWYPKLKEKWKIMTAAAVILLFFLRTEMGKTLLFLERPESEPLVAGVAVFATILFASFISAVKDRLRYSILALALISYPVFLGYILPHDLTVPYSTVAYYGNYGFKRAGEFLRGVVGPEDKLWTIDAIGYYYGGRYYTLYSDDRAGQEMANYVAAYRKFLRRRPWLTKNKKLIAIFGTVEIYSAKEHNSL